MDQQEMTLDQWVDKLPTCHRAYRELQTLKAEVAAKTAQNSAMDAIANEFIDLNDPADHEITIIRQFVAFVEQQHQ